MRFAPYNSWNTGWTTGYNYVGSVITTSATTNLYPIQTYVEPLEQAARTTKSKLSPNLAWLDAETEAVCELARAAA